MSQSGPRGRAVVAALLSVALATPAGGIAAPLPAAASLQVALPSQAGMAVRRALLSVRRRLATAPCRSVLTDFSAGEGRSLEAVLRELGRSPEAHLDSLLFRDGSTRPRCASQSILAFTNVGGDTVYVCARQFHRVAERDPAAADVVLIHEALHTLGLGENPPSSGEINARVALRCGA
jgi:hypothetical protein